MAINSIDSNAPESMQRWVEEVERTIAELQRQLRATQTQIPKGR